MDDYKRTLELDRAHVDADSGEFECVLFTSGEASDGHILNIRGGVLPDDMPLFVGHWADPIDQLGTLYPASRTETEAIYRGHIETGGSGANADIRRDLLLKMANGHVKRMSGRWDADAEHVTRRSELPKDHPAFVAGNAPYPQRSGMFFDQWRAVEGSIVGLGADPSATMRWARESESKAVRAFWRDHARDQALDAFKGATADLIDAGLTAAEIVESIQQAYKIERTDGELLARIDALTELVADIGERVTTREEPKPQEMERKKAAPLPAVTLDDVTKALRSLRSESETRMRQAMNKRLERAVGKVR